MCLYNFQQHNFPHRTIAVNGLVCFLGVSSIYSSVFLFYGAELKARRRPLLYEHTPTGRSEIIIFLECNKVIKVEFFLNPGIYNIGFLLDLHLHNLK